MSRLARLALSIAAVAAVLSFPWLPGVSGAMVINANLAGEYALIAISLVILTGWVGQISLGQGSFVGIGAFITGLLVRNLHVPFPVNLPIVAVACASVAAILGIVALRVRGLYLAVATLIFAWMADAYLFGSSWLVGAGGASSITNRPIGRPFTFTFFDLSNEKVFYLVIVASVSATVFLAVNLRSSKTGRAFFAVRGSEMAAVSLGIDITRYKLMAFAVSGGLAGMAGNLIMTDLRTATPSSFAFTRSLFYLSIAVVGGITSLGGAVSASALFAGLDILFLRYKWLGDFKDIIPVSLLLLVLLAYPGGLGAVGVAIGHRLRGILPKGTSPESTPPQPPPPRTIKEFSLPAVRADRRPVLEAVDIKVQFGGLVAVDNVTVVVREHEIVGLIGPNGAGKTTLFNAISGLNEPTEGTVHIFGRDATKLSVHARAKLGVGRTFQLIQLFPQLSVFENLMVATHLHNPTGMFSHVLLTDKAVRAEDEARRKVHAMVSFLDLNEVAHRRVAGLPFGILRRVEIARALVTESPLLMLDEPASGLDNTETEELSELLYFIRAELGTTILLIEHDVKMVTSVSDYMYVINQGKPLADGTPADIQRHPEVIAAYLGKPEAVAV